MKVLVPFLLLLSLQAPAFAQETCAPTDTIGRCWDKLKRAAEVSEEPEQESASSQGVGAVFEQLTSKATGLNELASASATEDFLPLLRFALVASGLQTEAEDRSVLGFERKIPIFDEKDPWELKLTGKANDPDVFEPLKMAFAEDIRDDRVSTLKEQFGDLDDYSLGLNLNRKGESFGRSLDATTRNLLRALFAAAFEEVDRADTLRAQDEFAIILSEEGLDDGSFINSISPNRQAAVLAKLAAAARATARTTEELRQALEAKGFFRVGDLLNNKPQVHGSATYRAREEIAGPSELSAKLTYEHDLSTNIKDLQDECGAKSGNDLLTCYQGFLSKPAVEEDLEHGDRLTFNADYKEIKPYRISFPDDDVSLDLDASSVLTLSLKYGRYFETGQLGPSARFDLDWSYEDVSDDPNRRDRNVASLTFSNRFLRSLGLSLGLSYANHAKYLPDIDEELSTHFGISYRLFSEEEK